MIFTRTFAGRVELGNYAMMPNRIHGIFVLHDRANVVSAWRTAIYPCSWHNANVDFMLNNGLEVSA